nr:hypothetical protein Iba_chr13cCG11300 [Ipomoea batatas]
MFSMLLAGTLAMTCGRSRTMHFIAGKHLAMAEATAPLPPATSTNDLSPSNTRLDSPFNNTSMINSKSLAVASLKTSLYPGSWEIFCDQKHAGVDQKAGEAVDVVSLGRVDRKGGDKALAVQLKSVQHVVAVSVVASVHKVPAQGE